MARALDRAGLTANYNAVPFDTRSPFDPSGIRLGTPAVTTRGMTTEHMVLIADWIERGVAAAKREDEAELARIRDQVLALAREFPVPGMTVAH